MAPGDPHFGSLIPGALPSIDAGRSTLSTGTSHPGTTLSLVKWYTRSLLETRCILRLCTCSSKETSLRSSRRPAASWKGLLKAILESQEQWVPGSVGRKGFSSLLLSPVFDGAQSGSEQGQGGGREGSGTEEDWHGKVVLGAPSLVSSLVKRSASSVYPLDSSWLSLVPRESYPTLLLQSLHWAALRPV